MKAIAKTLTEIEAIRKKEKPEPEVQAFVDTGDTWLKCICVVCQKKMKGRVIMTDPNVIHVKDMTAEELNL